MTRAELDAFELVLGAVGDTRVVLVTDAGGKSALALGLATVATARGRRVALIECDLAQSWLAARLGLDPSPGLCQYLRREAEAPQTLQPLVLAGPASGSATAPLTCVVAGDSTDDGSALLASEEFGHMLAKLRNAYDLVVLDGPPLHDEPSLLPVAAHADRTVACVPEPRIPKDLRASIDGLVVQV